MKRLAGAGNRVIFVNSISMGLPSLSSPELFAKIWRKLKSYAKLVRRTDEGLIVVSPITLPFYSKGWIRAINRRLLVLQIRLLMIAFHLRRPVLWIAIPTAFEVAGRLDDRALIYQVSDRYDANTMDHAVSGEVISRMHRALLERADLIYYSGRKLFEEDTYEHPNIRAKAKHLIHGVDYEHFAQATSREWITPEDVASIPHPRLGYFGAIDARLIDSDLIQYVSEKRPDWNWVLLGLKAAHLEIEGLPNVHFLGSKPYSEMPKYSAAFDVCVLPWNTNDAWVSYGSAIKVREYLATGKPVVISPLYEYESLDGILRISRGHDDFISKVEEALRRDNADQRAARQEVVREGTWDARTEEVSRDISMIVEATGATE
jgi:glycosyltransferase involved in cell wall biosynthesis